MTNIKEIKRALADDVNAEYKQGRIYARNTYVYGGEDDQINKGKDIKFIFADLDVELRCFDDDRALYTEQIADSEKAINVAKAIDILKEEVSFEPETTTIDLNEVVINGVTYVRK